MEDGSQHVNGVAYYSIDKTDAHGRVVAYSMQIKTVPRMDNATRMGLLEGINLPDDARIVRHTSTCEAFKSRALGYLMGTPYAQVTTATGTKGASIAAVSKPDC